MESDDCKYDGGETKQKRQKNIDSIKKIISNEVSVKDAFIEDEKP